MSVEAHVQGPFARPAPGSLAVLAVALLLAGLLAGCDRFALGSSGDAADAVDSVAQDNDPQPPAPPPVREWAVVVHGGFSTGSPEVDADRIERLRAVAETGAQRLAEGQAALQVVTDLIAAMEEDPGFNAGVGSTFNRRGVHEMSAAVMDGRTRAFGSVGGLRNLRSPIAAARGALESHQGGQLLGDPADALGRSLSLPRSPQDSFTTREQFTAWRNFRQEARRVEREGGQLSPPIDPVGAVALDSFGNLAAGASFGGYTDSAPEQAIAVTTVGPGLYADNRGAAVLALGPEDRLISCQYPAKVAADTSRSGTGLTDVLAGAVARCGTGGPLALIAVDPTGSIAILSPDAGTALLSAHREAQLPPVGSE